MEQTQTPAPRAAWWAAAAAILVACPLLYASFTSPADANIDTSGWALLLALCWCVGGVAIIGVDRKHRPADAVPRSRRPWLTLTLVVGVGLALASLVGGLVLAGWSVTAPLVAGPIDVASQQQPAVLFAVALVAGAAEELFFRIALPRLLRGWAYWVVPTALYTAVTLATGSFGLAMMAAILGTVSLWTYSRTRAWQAPVLIHAIWTCAMVAVFPRLVEQLGL